MKNSRLYCFLYLCLLFLSCSSKKDKPEEGSISTVLPDEISEVRALRLDYTDFHHELIANGTVSARNKADLRFQTSEVIAAIYVKNGDRVVKGQKIAMLDPFKLQNALSQARDSRERAKLDLQDVLIGQGYSLGDSARIPPEVMQIARVKSNYDQSGNQYALAEYSLQRSVLYAPFDGVVANLFAKVYNLPDASQPFCTIIDNARPEIEFKALESELAFLRTGDKFAFRPFPRAILSATGRLRKLTRWSTGTEWL